MNTHHNPKHLARRLRRQSTEAEKLLWQHLRYRNLGGAKFRRQHPLGSYIVDFVCLQKKLIVELDGGHHADDPVAARDRRRQHELETMGYRVLRFWDNDVLGNIEGVLQVIEEALQ